MYVFSRWPDGKYCIYKKGSSCPTGLDEGFVIWDDENKDNKNSREGVLPEGLFNEDTKIFFCCSTTGSASQEIALPNKAPFLLFAYDSILCQKVSLSKTNKQTSKQTLFEIQLCLQLNSLSERNQKVGNSGRNYRKNVVRKIRSDHPR